MSLFSKRTPLRSSPSHRTSTVAPLALRPKSFRRNTLCGTAVFLSLSLTASQPAQAQRGPISININGRTVDADPAPISVRGSVLVPLRGVLENLGAQVSYDAPTRRILISQGEKRVSLTIGSTSAIVDLKIVELTTAPRAIGSRVFVPLRSLAEIFGYGVNYVAGSRTVAITSGQNGPRTFANHREALKAAGPFGIAIDFTDATPSEVAPLLDAAKQSGAGLIKMRFDWNTLQPERASEFQWPTFDRIVREARQRNLTIIGVLGVSARWASRYAGTLTTDPNDLLFGPPKDNELPAWSNYVRRVVGRYGSDVQAWQIWENPNPGNFRGVSKAYRVVTRAGAEAARQADPKAIVYAAEPGGVDLGFIDDLNRNGLSAFVDGVTLYPASQIQPGVPYASDKFLLNLAALKRDLAAPTAAGQARDFWIGGLSRPIVEPEADGTLASVTSRDPDVRARLMSEFTTQAQADYLVKSETLALAGGAGKVFWNRLRDVASYERADPINGSINSGLLRRDLTPRGSFQALRTLSAQVGDKPFAGALSTGPDVVALLFDNGTDGTVVAWSPTGRGRVVFNLTGTNPNVPGALYVATGGQTQVFSSTGNVLAGQEGVLPLSDSPILISNIGYETRNAVKAQSQPERFVLNSGASDFSQAANASISFGAPNGEAGISRRGLENLRNTASEIVSANGRTGLVTEIQSDITNPNSGKPYIFLDVADDYLFFGRGVPVKVTIEVKRPEAGTSSIFNQAAGFALEYDTPSGFRSTAYQVVEPGTGFATYTFALPNVSFANRNGYDLLINTGASRQNLMFTRISVERGD